VLWALQNKSQGELLNEAVLLQNVIDFILDKMDYRGALRSEFDFTSKNAVLQYLAYETRDRSVSHDINDITAIVIRFLKRKALRYDAGEIVASFLKCGILQQVGDEVGFKYDRFQDFFVAGFFRDNEDALNEALQGKNWIASARELDLYTARFRHEARLLARAQRILDGTAKLSGELDQQNVYTYLKDGHSALAASVQLRKMKKQQLSAAQVDTILERAEREQANARALRATVEQKNGGGGPEVLFERQAALNLYSQFIRNLEFADREDKETHLKACIDCWEELAILLLSATREVFARITKDNEGTKRKGFSEITVLIESVVKEVMPVFVATNMYNELASEKLAELLDEIVGSETLSTLRGLMCAFILLELRPEQALSRIKEQYKSFDMWTAGAVTHRLYDFYQSRPLSDKLRPKFEALVIDLEASIGRLEVTGRTKSFFLQSLHKHAFREDQSG
jgi:hypothetical protein